MSTLEQEIIEKYNQLDDAGKERIKAAINGEVETLRREFDYEQWKRQWEAIWAQIRSHQSGEPPEVSAVELLRRMRDGEDEDEE